MVGGRVDSGCCGWWSALFCWFRCLSSFRFCWPRSKSPLPRRVPLRWYHAVQQKPRSAEPVGSMKMIQDEVSNLKKWKRRLNLANAVFKYIEGRYKRSRRHSVLRVENRSVFEARSPENKVSSEIPVQHTKNPGRAKFDYADQIT